MAEVSNIMPVWMLTLLDYDWDKFTEYNFNKFLAKLKFYINENKLLISEEIIPVEKNIKVPENLLDLLNFIDFAKLEKSNGDATKFRQFFYEIVKSLSEV